MKAHSTLPIRVFKELALFSLLLAPHARLEAATNDVTGVVPALTTTFDNDSVVNINGVGGFAMVTPEGTTKFVTSLNGRAIDISSFTPYGNITNVAPAGCAFSVSAFATLGATANGIMFHLRDDTGGTGGGLVLRRGANATDAVITLNHVSSPILTVTNIASGATLYHHYAVVATSTGLTFYVDGVAKGWTPSNAVTAAKNYYQFGSRHTGCVGGESKYGGQIDDFRVYNAALTPAQVQILAAAIGGLISVKTGTRDDTTSGGNIALWGANLGAVQSSPTTWNKTTNAQAGAAGVLTNLISGAGSPTGVKLYYACVTNAISGAGTNTPSGTLTKTYFDDGTAATYTVSDGGTGVVLPDPGVTRGWEVMLTGVPYTNADLYVVLASGADQTAFKACPIMVKVGDGAWTNYCGEPGLEKTLVGTQTWAGATFAVDTLKEGNHYLKIPLSGLTTNTAIAIAHGARDVAGQTRFGLAGLQLAKRDASADTSYDPYFLRTVTGSASWSDSAWQNKGTPNNAWQDSSPSQKTTAILTSSGTTTLTLPDNGVTAEAFSVKGSGTFALSGAGALSLNGGMAIDAFGMAATGIVSLGTAVLGTNITLTANNTNATSTGYVQLTNPTNDFDTLTVTKGAFAADSILPGDATVILNGGNLLFPSSATFSNALQLAADARIGVLSAYSAAITNALTSSFNLIKTGNGALTLSGGASCSNLLFENSGTLSLTGTRPYAFVDSLGGSAATTLNVAAPLTFSGRFSLGGATLTLASGGTVTASALRWCDTGPYNTTVNQSGGRITVLGAVNSVTTSDSALFAHYPGTLNYTQSGGEFIATNAVVLLTWDGTTTWTLGSSARAYVNGINMRGQSKTGASTTLTLSGGTLEVGASGIFATQTTSTRTINLGAGTVRAWGDFTVAASAVSSAASLTDSSSGTTLDANGKTVTWNAAMSGSGKLVVNDSSLTPGTVVLAAGGSRTGATEIRNGTLAIGAASALGSGSLYLAGGTLSLGSLDVTAGALTATNPATLKIRVGVLTDFSDSGSLAPSSLVIQGDATNALQVVLDLHGLGSVLTEYPIIKSASTPTDATSHMTVSFVNAGTDLPATAAVALERRSDGVYAVFTGTTTPKALYWHNGHAMGTWSTNATDTPWGINAVNGTTAAFTNSDYVSFTDTDQSSVTVSVKGAVSPGVLAITNASTSYAFADAGAGLLTMPDLALAKLGTGSVAFGMPVAFSNSLTVAAGTLAFNAALGTVSNATCAASLTIATNATMLFGCAGATQTLAGALSGTGMLAVTSGRLKINTSGASFGGTLVASNGVLELAKAYVLLGSTARFQIAAGSTCEVTALDTTGYDVTNANPIILAGTLTILQRDSNARGLVMYDGAEMLLKGDNMDSTHALDLFCRPTFALVSGAASIRPLDPTNAAQASMIVRTEHSPKTFEVRDSNAVFTVAVPFIGGDSNTALAKTGPGLMRWTAVSTASAKIQVLAGTLEIGTPGQLGAGASSQPIEIATNAVFRYASATNQTLSGSIACSGAFVKTGTGALTISGAFTVNGGGVFSVPAVESASSAVVVNGSSLTLNGGVQVSNAGSLQGGKTYTLLTSGTALPSDIASRVTVDQHRWTVTTTNSGKTLQIYRSVGMCIMVK